MKSTRKLALRREILVQLDRSELAAVDGAAPPATRRQCPPPESGTCYSCLTYISCYETDCIA